MADGGAITAKLVNSAVAEITARPGGEMNSAAPKRRRVQNVSSSYTMPSNNLRRQKLCFEDVMA